MTYLQDTLQTLKWFLLTVGKISAAGGLVCFAWHLLPERVKKKIFEED